MVPAEGDDTATATCTGPATFLWPLDGPIRPENPGYGVPRDFAGFPMLGNKLRVLPINLYRGDVGVIVGSHFCYPSLSVLCILLHHRIIL